MRERNKSREHFPGHTGRNSVGCEFSSVPEVCRDTGGNQSGGGIDYHDVSRRAGLPCQAAAAGRLVPCRCSTAKRFQRCTRYAELFRCHGKTPDRTFFHFSHVGYPTERNLVEAAGHTHYDGALLPAPTTT